MISRQQLAGSLTGLWLLLRFDTRAWDHFDKSPRGFWNSFAVAFLLAPIQLAHVAFQYKPGKSSDLPFVPYMVVETLAYVLGWTLLPFAMLYITRLLNRTPRYFWHMVPYNWMQLPLALPLFTAQLLTDIHLLPPGVLSIFSPVVLIALAVYGTFVAAIGLQVATGTAFGLAILDFILGLITDQIISRI